MKELVYTLWMVFFTAALIWMWLFRPPLPKGSGRMTTWVRYEEQPKTWRAYAYLITAFIALLVVITTLQTFPK